MSSSVLIVDDEAHFMEELQTFLESHGIRCATTTDPRQLTGALEQANPDLVVLDHNFGFTTGLEVLRELRKTSTIPCVMLTGREDPIDRILGLELGADDYIQKTTLPREILARIRAVLRRVQASRQEPVGPGPKNWDFRVDERELYSPEGQRCHLTSTEFTFLQVLMGARGDPVSRDILTQSVFNRPYRAGDRAIDGLVVRLRRKVEPDPENPIVIKSARQQGYVFTGFAQA